MAATACRSDAAKTRPAADVRPSAGSRRRRARTVRAAAWAIERKLGTPAPRRARVDDDRMHRSSSRARFAQRARRQQPAVAEAARGVDHRDFVVARQSRVLEPVVADDDVRALLGRETRRGHPVRADRPPCARHAARCTSASSPVTRGSSAASRPGRTAMRSAVAPQDHADPRCRAPRADVRARRRRGVLPVPPTVRLPTTMTGTPTCSTRSSRMRYSSARNARIMPIQQGQRPQRQAAPGGAVPDALQPRVERHASVVELQAVQHGVLAVARQQFRVGARFSTTRPASMTMMRSAFSTVDRRCAMTSVVRLRMSASSCVLDLALDSVSSAEVASSRIRIGAFLQQRARDRDALALAARQQRAAIAHDGIEPVRQLRAELVHAALAAAASISASALPGSRRRCCSGSCR